MIELGTSDLTRQQERRALSRETTGTRRRYDNARRHGKGYRQHVNDRRSTGSLCGKHRHVSWLRTDDPRRGRSAVAVRDGPGSAAWPSNQLWCPFDRQPADVARSMRQINLVAHRGLRSAPHESPTQSGPQMTYYSVDRHGACAAGKHFHLDPCGVPARNATAVDHINTLYPDGFSPHGAMYYRDAIDNLATTVGDFTCSADYLSALIELLLETTRQAHYPHKPSQCGRLCAVPTAFMR